MTLIYLCVDAKVIFTLLSDRITSRRANAKLRHNAVRGAKVTKERKRDVRTRLRAPVWFWVRQWHPSATPVEEGGGCFIVRA
jgi:hypothetical protein